MSGLQFSRKQMAQLLANLRVDGKKPVEPTLDEVRNGTDEAGADPEIIQKLIKRIDRPEVGFSLNEIVALGNLLEFTKLSHGAVQNWVKRDVKELIGSPLLGKKYTVEQAATLFIVEDLKHSLGFESIRSILQLVFNNPEDRSDDIIDPVDLFFAYASLFDRMQLAFRDGMDQGLGLNGTAQQWIETEAAAFAIKYETISKSEKQAIRTVISICLFSVQSAWFQYQAKMVTGELLK
ncbi:DUF1836 domain-containing protein [Bacillus marinisedimentorum]|uniref:DUF1836 domain-containing protein n=1 Tax=Bacillus marinisedimentorum TaxID=1821260 RepID=UPI0007E2739B|nr:DUF1836 domain-containing protein [Bacillus marinisedimentorum]